MKCRSPAVIESLEARALLSAWGVFFRDHTLVIRGYGMANVNNITVTLSPDGTNVIASVQPLHLRKHPQLQVLGQSIREDASLVRHLLIDVRDGSGSSILIGTSASPISIPAHITGGNGSDTIVGGMGDDYIRCRGGDDFVDGRGPKDTIIGGTGADTIAFHPGDHRRLHSRRTQIVAGDIPQIKALTG